MKKLCKIWICICLICGGLPQSIRAAHKNAASPEFSFGVVADVQYCDSNNHGERYFRESLQKLREAVQDFNTKELSFVIQVGDFIDRDFVSFGKVLPIYQQVKAPIYHVLGNHDFLVNPEEKEMVTGTLGLQRTYYEFTYHSWRFIVLNGNDLSFHATPKESEKYADVEVMYQQIVDTLAPNAQKWNGGVGRRQFTWLKKQLDDALKNGQKVILFCHFPIFPPDQHNLWNDTELVGLLEVYPNVMAYISGHNHAGNYREKQGIHYLTLHGMVETQQTNAYAIVEIFSDHLNVIGKGREPSRILRIK